MLVKTKFDDFVRLNRGFDLPDSKIVEGEYPVVASTYIKAYHNDYKIKPPVVVTGRSGSLGKVQYIDENCWPLNTSLYSKDFKGNHPKYVYYYLQTMHLEQYNAGAGVPTLNQNHLQKLKIKIHPIEEQKKVADVLSKYDELIELNNKRIKLLEKAAEELYKEWFVRFRFPNYQNTEFENGIPKGWVIKRLSEFGRIETGKTPSTENPENYGVTYLFVKTPDMHGSTFITQTEEMLSEVGNNSQPKKLLPKNSIMVSCIGTAGIVAITTKPSHTNQQINSIVLNDVLQLEWLFQTCKSLKNTIKAFGATGATMTNLSKGKFEKLKVISPETKLIEEYHVFTKPIFEKIKELTYKNENLIKQRDLLLPRLMSGKLEV